MIRTISMCERSMVPMPPRITQVVQNSTFNDGTNIYSGTEVLPSRANHPQEIAARYVQNLDQTNNLYINEGGTGCDAVKNFHIILAPFQLYQVLSCKRVYAFCPTANVNVSGLEYERQDQVQGVALNTFPNQ